MIKHFQLIKHFQPCRSLCFVSSSHILSYVCHNCSSQQQQFILKHMCEDQTMIICTLMGYIIQSHLQNVKQMNCSKQEAEYNIANTNAAYRRAEISNMQEISREKNAKIKQYSRYLLCKPHIEKMHDHQKEV